MSATLSISIEPAEWARVAALARAADLDEVRDQAIWLRDDGAERLWVVQTDSGPLVVRGDGTCGEQIELGRGAARALQCHHRQ